jgi:hypothetical protein
VTLIQSAKISEKWVSAFVRLPWLLQWVIINVLALLLYAPVINNSFLNDDFYVIKKVCLDGQLNTNGFFRPLSDISIFLTWQVFGMNPVGYYLTGILLHALNALLIFHFCLRWRWLPDKISQQAFAFVAALLFLTYPFHNESVAWILGRGALVSNLFGMAGLLILISDGKEIYKIGGVCLCYFAGLAIYETVIVLPAMIVLYLMVVKRDIRKTAWWALFLGITLILHFMVRFWVSGGVTGDYGSGFFIGNVMTVLVNIFKVTGRMVLPPVDNSILFVVLFSIILLLAAFVFIYLWRAIKNNKPAKQFFLVQCSFLLIALSIPYVTAVSTHTSESDRFLHLPSYFFCILAAFALIIFFKTGKWLVISIGVILCYQIFFLETNNLNWHKASSSVRTILGIIKNHAAQQKIYIVNLPDEIDGAFVFRNGFKEALILNKMDTAAVVVVSRLKRDDELQIPGIIEPEKQLQETFIPPFVTIHRTGDSTHIKKQNKITVTVAEKDRVVFWNKHKWVEL